MRSGQAASNHDERKQSKIMHRETRHGKKRSEMQDKTSQYKTRLRKEGESESCINSPLIQVRCICNQDQAREWEMKSECSSILREEFPLVASGKHCGSLVCDRNTVIFTGQ